jgi:hypothetical protein
MIVTKLFRADGFQCTGFKHGIFPSRQNQNSNYFVTKRTEELARFTDINDPLFVNILDRLTEWGLREYHSPHASQDPLSMKPHTIGGLRLLSLGMYDFPHLNSIAEFPQMAEGSVDYPAF